jgi:hypothetical protein
MEWNESNNVSIYKKVIKQNVVIIEANCFCQPPSRFYANIF